MSIGNNIKKYRKYAHLTQIQLAQKINKSESTIQKYEANNVKPDFSVLDDIAEALNVSMIELIKDDTIESSVNKLNYLEQYIKTLGYEIDGDESEGYLVINTPEGTYEITEDDITDLTNTTKSFILFKLQEIIKHSRKIGK